MLCTLLFVIELLAKDDWKFFDTVLWSFALTVFLNYYITRTLQLAVEFAGDTVRLVGRVSQAFLPLLLHNLLAG